ncbi:acyltransferase domain-containing protein, partial [Niastella yeongjuensis]|uniref:acyltransferase domain-containing protein n=1 Tax=Niastella yeongjuensis TaxID=354355 RepID=UPI001056CB8E
AGAFVNDRISLAAINGPEQVVLSGEVAAIEALRVQLESQGIASIRLHTSHAFHSAMLDGIKESFRKEWEGIQFNSVNIPFVSNITGEFITASAVSADYWVRHMREAVRFSDGLQTILSQGKGLVFVEVGPGNSLISLLKQQKAQTAPVAMNLVRSVKETADDHGYFTGRIGELWAKGVAIDWNGYYKDQQRRKISLPTYSFEPVKYPTEVDPIKNYLQAGLNLGLTENKELKDWV